MTRTRVLLTGFDGVDETGPGLSVGRALKAGLGDDVQCTALISDRDVPAAWMGSESVVSSQVLKTPSIEWVS